MLFRSASLYIVLVQRQGQHGVVHQIQKIQVLSHLNVSSGFLDVSNNSRVTRVIFRDACFNFTNKVSTNVSTFGENTAAKTGKDRNQ